MTKPTTNHKYDSLNAYAPQKTKLDKAAFLNCGFLKKFGYKKFKPPQGGFSPLSWQLSWQLAWQKLSLKKKGFRHIFSFSCFFIFMLTLFSFLLINTAQAAQQQLTLEVWQNEELRSTCLLQQNNQFPLLPITKLSEICQVPIAWETTENGSALIWGRLEIATVLMANRAEIIALSGGNTANPTFYQYTTAEKPRISNGQFAVPLSSLPFLGIDYKLFPKDNKIQILLPPRGYNTLATDKVWQATKEMVNTIQKPKSNCRLLATATTNYKAKETARTHNLLLATEAIHGTVINPGETFSFNQTVGQRTPQKGYKKAIIFSAQEKVMDYGGGICQVSTTLYQSSLKAKLQTKERHSHSLPVAYAGKNKDATVAWGSKDFKFRNNTKKTIYIVGKMHKGKLTIEIWQGKIPKILPEVASGDL